MRRSCTPSCLPMPLLWAFASRGTWGVSLLRRLRPLLRSRLPRSVSASAIGSKLSNRIIVACVVGFSAVPLRSRRRFPMGRCTLLTWLRLVADEHAKWSAQWTGSAAHMLEETWRWCLALGAPSDSWTPEALFPSAAALQTAVRASARRAAGIDGWSRLTLLSCRWGFSSR